MSFELIDDIDEKYPLERFTRDSVIKMNIASIMWLWADMFGSFSKKKKEG
ncbi:hypothetical protein LCGC14_1249790 [marine sediment metagenome]|uniref:Uncharacterized protein n=1 Tax=marine sediment metagenome TaxID=412755 RepID=A0A0F9L3C0_9ZZZZ